MPFYWKDKNNCFRTLWDSDKGPHFVDPDCPRGSKNLISKFPYMMKKRTKFKQNLTSNWTGMLLDASGVHTWLVAEIPSGFMCSCNPAISYLIGTVTTLIQIMKLHLFRVNIGSATRRFGLLRFVRLLARLVSCYFKNSYCWLTVTIDLSSVT